MSVIYDGCFEDEEWRLNHLYFINTKSMGITRFKMNRQQRELYHNLHTRNAILKARQLGMSTFSCILSLDRCLFHNAFNAGIIDRTQDDAEEKVSKIKLAYNSLANPPESPYDHVTDPEDRLRIKWFTQNLLLNGVQATFTKSGADFTNGSTLRTGMTLRGYTIHYLHVSEYGSIAAHDEPRALEIRNGSFPCVPSDGCLIVESTHEGGQNGENYRILKNAMDCVGKRLTHDQWKFFFFSWIDEPSYKTESEEPLDVGHLASYFEELEKVHNIHLTDAQKRWYCNREKEFDIGVKTEYPTIPEEALMGQIEGSIYGRYIMELRKQGRMSADFEVSPFYPMYVSWDLGVADYTSMWLWQVGGDGKFYVVDYFCSHRKHPDYYFNQARKWEREYGIVITHLLPHDSKQTDWSTNMPRFLAFEKAFGSGSYRLVKRVNRIWEGIDATKQFLRYCVFHKRCSKSITDENDGKVYVSGIDALERYKTKPNSGSGAERNEPLHDESSHGCFIAGTKILTPTGNKNIEDIKIGDYVVTPTGIRKVVNAGCTGFKDVMELCFSNGTSITCTGNHPIFSEKGIERADTLRYNSRAFLINWKHLLLWNTLSLFGLMEKSIGYRETIIRAITGEAAQSSTEPSGSSITRKVFRKVGMFITLMEILLITPSKILSASLWENICPDTQESENGVEARRTSVNFAASTIWQNLGTLPLKAVNGIKTIAKRLGQNVSGTSAIVLNADKSLNPLFRLVLNIALENASSVTRLVKRENKVPRKVYNLTIEGDHCYYANGILVSNCDAFRLFVEAYEGGLISKEGVRFVNPELNVEQVKPKRRIAKGTPSWM